MTGLSESSIACCAASTTPSYSRVLASLERRFSNSEMSAPAAKATVPSPRNTMQRIASSASNCAIASGIARHMLPAIALRRAGLSNTMRPIDPSRSTRSLASLMISSYHSYHLGRAQLGDLGRGILELAQKFVVVLARGPDRTLHLCRRARQTKGRPDQMKLAARARRDRNRHAEVLDLRIGEHFVHLV